MDEFNLTQYVNARCGEVYLSNEGTLIFLCSLCNDSFKGYGLYLGHIISEHDLPVHSVEEIEVNNSPIFSIENEVEVADSIATIDGNEIVFSDPGNDMETYGETNIQAEFDADTKLSEDGNDIETYGVTNIQAEFDVDTKFSVYSIDTKLKREDYKDCDFIVNDQEIGSSTHPESDELVEAKDEQVLSADENTPNIENDLDFKITNKYEYPSQGLFDCPICQLSIKGKSNLEKHVLRHNDDNKRFQCAYCPKRFHVKFELRQHEASHTGERPYLCTICGRRFVSTGKLNEHTNMIHENIRNKVCEICNKAFYSNKYLRRHMMTHSTERTQKCEICGASFKIRKTLAAHMKLHLNKLEYKCKLCCAQFNQRPALHSHMKSRHKSFLKQTTNSNDSS